MYDRYKNWGLMTEEFRLRTEERGLRTEDLRQTKEGRGKKPKYIGWRSED